MPCDGFSLAKTVSNSMDLVQVHKLFPFLPFLNIISYFAEMARVVRPGGKVIFDIFTEDCFDEAMVAKYLDAKAQNWDIAASLMAKKYAIDFMSRRGLSLVSAFFGTLGIGKTEYLVFSKG